MTRGMILILMFCAIFPNTCAIVSSESNVEMDLSDINNSTRALTHIEEGRKKEKSLMERILPMMVMPFMIQLSLAPMMLMSMKMMLMKGMFVGKLAIIFGLLTFMRNLFKNPGGVYSHNVNVLPDYHNVNHHRRERGLHVYTRKKKKRSALLCSEC